MSDGLSDRIILTKERADEGYEMWRNAKEIRGKISHVLEVGGASCQELPTPECFPHQGRSTLVTDQHGQRESEVCVHVHPASDSTMIVTVSRAIMVSSDIADEDIKSITDFIGETAFYDFDSEE